MLRVIVVTLLASALALGNALPTAAFDYEPQFVPPQFLLNAPPADAPTPPAGASTPNRDARLLAQGTRAAVGPLNGTGAGNEPAPAGSADPAWTHDGAPGTLRFVPNSQWTDGGGGCAVWNWTSC